MSGAENTSASALAIHLRTKRSISSDVRPVVAGSTAVISVKCSSTRGHCHTRHRINRMTGAQFEISIEGVPRTYRDQKDLALQSAQIPKSRIPNSVVRLKDLKTGEEIVIAFKAAQ